MTFKNIYDEIINLRFNTTTQKTAQVKNWVNQAETWVWNQADWHFKRVGLQSATPTITSSLARVDLSSLGSKGSKVHAVYNANGFELMYLPPDEWEAIYAVGTIPTGTYPEAYTIMTTGTSPPVTRALFVGPASTSAVSIAVRRRYYHLDSAGGNLVAGVMSADTDVPCWDSEYHYLLVYQGMMIGEKLEDDPTSEMLRVQRDEMLAAMKDELVGTVEDPWREWGSSTVGSA